MLPGASGNKAFWQPLPDRLARVHARAPAPVRD